MSQDGLYSGVTADPEANFPDGGTIRCQSWFVRFPQIVGTSHLSAMHALEGVVLTLAFDGPDETFVEGSAVMVAPGVALCALHVLEPRTKEMASGEWFVRAIAVLESGLRIWIVKHATIVPNSDLAILGLVLNSAISPGDTFNHASLTTRLPAEGELLTVVGTVAAAKSFPKKDGALGDVTLGAVASTGPVVERYLSGRDKFMMPWPSLQVNCQSAGGMSGGPVFDKEGHLVGVLCSSVDDGTRRPEPSFVSLHLPALIQPFLGGWPPGIFHEPRSLLDSDLCSIDRRDALIQQEEMNGMRPYKYTAW